MMKPFHLAYIDGLRAIAVLAVIVYHLNSNYLPGGFAGVDVFFVISGFVVAMSASKFTSLSMASFLSTFYARRLLRIYPALVVCLVLTVVASALFIPQAWLSSTNDKSGLMAFFGLSNFVLAADAGGYFSPRSDFNPFTHTWSLAVEEQFYLVFPFFFYFWLQNRCRISNLMFGLGLIISLGCSFYLAGINQINAFYMTWSRFWELAAGVLLFQQMAKVGYKFQEVDAKKTVPSWVTVFALALLIVGILSAQENRAPFPTCTPVVIATMLLLWALYGNRCGLIYRVFTSRVLVAIGKRSYSLYLWHWPIFVLMRWTSGLSTVEQELIALLLTSLFAFVSYSVIEQRTRYAFKRFKPKWVILIGLILIAVSAYLSNVLVKNKALFSFSIVTQQKALWDPEANHAFVNESGCTLSVNSSPLKGGSYMEYSRTGCNTAPSFEHQIFVLGDSHAMHYSSMLKTFAVNTGAKVFMYQFPGCSYMPMRVWNPGICDDAAKIAIADILTKIKEGDVVFLPSLRIERFVDQWVIYGIAAAREGTLGAAAVAARKQQLDRSVPQLQQLTDRGALVVLEAPTPMLMAVPFRCADWFNKANPICAYGLTMDKQLLEELRRPVLEAYQEIENKVRHTAVWDPMPVLCPEETCNAFMDGRPLMFDGDHLTFYANELLYPDFFRMIKSLDHSKDGT